jgi:hypothetical protein
MAFLLVVLAGIFHGGLMGSNGNFNGIWLVVVSTPLKNMSESQQPVKITIFAGIVTG